MVSCVIFDKKARIMFLNLIWLQNNFSLREIYNISCLGSCFRTDIIARREEFTIPVIWIDDSAAKLMSTRYEMRSIIQFIQLSDAAQDSDFFLFSQSCIIPQIPYEFTQFVRWMEIQNNDIRITQYAYLPCFIYEEVRHLLCNGYPEIQAKLESNLAKPIRQSETSVFGAAAAAAAHTSSSHRPAAGLRFSHFPVCPYPMVQLASCYLKIRKKIHTLSPDFQSAITQELQLQYFL